MDHDQRFKAMIREFFKEFMELFFAQWAEEFDLTSIEWMDKELFSNPPEGDRHVLDLVAKVPTKSEQLKAASCYIVVHLEIESPDSTTNIKSRLPSYYLHLRRLHDLPVLPIVLFMKVGLNGIGVDEWNETVGSFPVLTLRYHYVGLPALDAVQYIQGENWLGVALSALMKIPKDEIVRLGAIAMARLAESSLNEYQKFLLSDCFQAYVPIGRN